jgi:hypothetical protein
MLLLVTMFTSMEALAQYGISYSYSWYDLTFKLPTVNALKLLAGGGSCKANTLSVGRDGTMFCFGNQSGYVPYFYNFTTGAWTQNTAMGTSMSSIVVGDENNIFALGAGNACGNDSYIYKWSGSSWTQVTGCLTQLSVGASGFLAGVNSGKQMWQSLDGGNTWTEISSGTFGYVVAADQYDMCTSNGSGYLYASLGGGGFEEIPGTPGGALGCAITVDNFLYTWGSFGTKVYDIINNVWTSITGSISSMAAYGKNGAFTLDSNGHIYHLNVITAQITATVSGSWNNCPGAQGCPPSAVHTGHIQVHYPHGIYGLEEQQGVPPTSQLNVSSFDVSPLCDPFVDPEDPECEPSAPVANVICSITSDNLLGGNPSLPTMYKSEDLRYWDKTVEYGTYQGNVNAATDSAFCGTGVNACYPGSSATCAANTPPLVEEYVTCKSPAGICTPAFMQQEGEFKCFLHQQTPGSNTGIAWEFDTLYSQIGSNRPVCSAALKVEDSIGGFPCR